ncbi:MAG: SBBP repeat-containing protein [Bacteroidia bacterium]
MKKVYFAIISLFLITHSAFAQPVLAWEQHYNGPGDQGDEAVSIAVDASGNSYVTGSAFALNGTLDFVTIKYSPSGQQLWLQSYNGTASDNDQGLKLVLDAAANVYVTGYSKGSGTGNDITTIKYSSAGAQQWVAIYNGAFNGQDEGASVAVDASGNVFVTGFETTSNFYYSDLVTIMYNAAGSQVWVDIYDGPGNANDYGVDVVNDGAGNTYVVGTSDTLYMSQPNNDIVVLKYNNAGTRVWRRVYWSPTYSYDIARKMCLDNNGNILICGYGGLPNQGNNYYTIKYDPAGACLWSQFYNYAVNTYEQPWGIVADSLGNVIVTGQGVTSVATATNDYVTVKYNAAGVFQWVSRFNGTGNANDYAYALALDDSLNIFVTGTSQINATSYNIATVKYDAAGNQIYVLNYNGAANLNDQGNAIVVKNTDIYVAGKSATAVNDDYLTLRYSYSAVGIDEQNAIPLSLEIFPNPSTDYFHIIIPGETNVYGMNYSYIISNITGQHVKQGVALPEESTGTKTAFGINAAGLDAGVYFVAIYAEGEIAGEAKFVVR